MKFLDLIVRNLNTLRELLEMQEMKIQSLGWKDPLVEEMATHSSIAWEIPGSEEPDRL